MVKYRVTLVPEERAALEHLVHSGRASSRKLIHARILLLADGPTPIATTNSDSRRELGVRTTP
jgi:hypothetical protein